MRLNLGEEYTVEELIRRMIIYSDNVAASLLEMFDQKQSLMQASLEMDIPVRKGTPPLRDLSVKEYAGFFRILYNASYLSRYHSNWALTLLSNVEYHKGIPKGSLRDTRGA